LLSELAKTLGLGVASRSWHTARDGLAEFASWLSLVSGTLGKIGQDVAMMAQNEIGETVLAGGGKSSAMHHKSNPVQAELLVALARFNATQLSGLHQALIHEQERSGAAWTLEWMVLPGMVSACGASIIHASNMLNALALKSGPFSDASQR
jgi:3-carboxy-cis,cis-muconate cycloisomerase